MFILACPFVEKNNTNMTCHHTNQVHPKKNQQKHRSFSTSNLVLKQDISQATSKVAKTQEKILQPHEAKAYDLQIIKANQSGKNYS